MLGEAYPVCTLAQSFDRDVEALDGDCMRNRRKTVSETRQGKMASFTQVWLPKAWKNSVCTQAQSFDRDVELLDDDCMRNRRKTVSETCSASR